MNEAYLISLTNEEIQQAAPILISAFDVMSETLVELKFMEIAENERELTKCLLVDRINKISTIISKLSNAVK